MPNPLNSVFTNEIASFSNNTSNNNLLNTHFPIANIQRGKVTESYLHLCYIRENDRTLGFQSRRICSIN